MGIRLERVQREKRGDNRILTLIQILVATLTNALINILFTKSKASNTSTNLEQQRQGKPYYKQFIQSRVTTTMLVY